MKQIIAEYGSAVISMICTVLILGLVVALIFGGNSPLGMQIAKFANDLGGGVN